MQKLLDKALYANGRPSAQKIRNFLNGTWLGEPLHAALTDVPIGAWTVAIMFDALDLIRNRREFSLAADTSLAIGLAGAVGAALAGITDWSDVDPPARHLGLIHGLLNVGVTALFTTSLVLRKRESRTGGRVFSDRVRHFLKRRHKVQSRGAEYYYGKRVFGELKVIRLGPPPQTA